MPCDHQFITEHVWDYVDGKLPEPMRRRCEAALAGCPECRQVHTRALEFNGMAERWREQPVPAWHRARFAVRPPPRQFNWLNGGALAASCLALILVVLEVEVSLRDGLWISVGGGQSEARLQALLDRELADFRDASSLVLEERLADYSRRREAANNLLMSEWMERAREERHNEFRLVMDVWETRSDQERRVIDRRLDTLADYQIESGRYLNDLIKNADMPASGGNL